MANTVALARTSGCIETVEPKRHLDSKKCSHVIVIDFESTCWKEKRIPPEIIEFPACLLELSTGKICDEFHHYLTPVENPILSEFCKELTGITQKQVDDGIPLKTCLLLFQLWYNEMLRKYKASSIPMVTWSDWDFGTCLNKECERKLIKKPEIFNSWIDIRALFRAHTKKPTRGLKTSMSDIGLHFEGREHSGIVDARNIAKVVLKLHMEGVVLKPTTDTKKFC